MDELIQDLRDTFTEHLNVAESHEDSSQDRYFRLRWSIEA